MGRRIGTVHGAVSERQTIQKEIKERYGEVAIRKARVRLCSECKERNCSLLPLTLKGEDCPYFKPKEVKK